MDFKKFNLKKIDSNAQKDLIVILSFCEPELYENLNPIMKYLNHVSMANGMCRGCGCNK